MPAVSPASLLLCLFLLLFYFLRYFEEVQPHLEGLL